MADKDYRTETNHNVIGGCFKLPRIQVPKVFEEDDWGAISFGIKTSKGVIKVTSSGCQRGIWKCRGDIPSLVAGGFIQPDWCPGLHGNNKTRQTVVFKNDIPWLIYGNHRGTALPHPSIVIFRISKNKFEVEVLATKEQREIISQARKRCDQRMLNERSIKEQQEKIKQKSDIYSSPILFKNGATNLLKMCLEATIHYLNGRREFSEYSETTLWIDEQSAQDIVCAGERLIDAVRKAKVVCLNKKRHLSIVNSIT